MKDLIQKINPPGLLNPNRGALFATIGSVFEQVKKDAEKAFNAHFPYLADMQKLMQQGKSLSIPRFAYDSDEEYRKRVAAAAFYYTNAGGRSYTILIFSMKYTIYLRVNSLYYKELISKYCVYIYEKFSKSIAGTLWG